MIGYDLMADGYEENRPGYPAAAIDRLVNALGVGSTSTVLDLAAGTGKLTRLLVPRVDAVVAVEPVKAMRTALAAAVPGVEIRYGTAEAIPLEGNTVDAVVVGQAFHWFDGSKALSEIARVLRPGAQLGLIWNVRDETSEPQRRVGALLARYRGNSRTYRNSGWQASFTASPSFSPLESAHFPHEHPVDRDGLIGLIMSMSYMPLLTAGDRGEAIEAAASIVEDLADEFGMISLRYDSRIYWTTALRR